MKNNRSNMRAEAVKELKKICPEIEAESTESRTTRSSALLWIIFWVVIIGGAIALFEVLR